MANTELRYYPYGATRYNTANQLTTYRPSTALRMYFTGQRTVVGTGGLYFYNARWYDPVVGRFLQADSIVPSPGDPQSLNRYAYVLNNPLKYRDPTGHWVESAFDVISLGLTLNDIRNEGFTFWNAVSLVTDVASVALPIVPAGASHVIRAGKLANKAVNAADSVSDAGKLVNSADAAANTARFINGADNAGDAFRPLSNLPDGEILYQFSRKPQDGNFQGFPDTLRTKQGETGMSCQIASLCGHDPVQGFKQQMEGQKPRPGDWVRETTVGDVKQWGGRVEYDGFPGNPWNYPPGHGTISSTGGKWGKPFDRIWRNARPIAE